MFKTLSRFWPLFTTVITTSRTQATITTYRSFLTGLTTSTPTSTESTLLPAIRGICSKGKSEHIFSSLIAPPVYSEWKQSPYATKPLLPQLARILYLPIPQRHWLEQALLIPAPQPFRPLFPLPGVLLLWVLLWLASSHHSGLFSWPF